MNKSYFQMKVELEKSIKTFKEQAEEIREEQQTAKNRTQLMSLIARRKKINAMIRSIQMQLETIGDRRGEKIDHEEWISDLPIENDKKEMFIRLYQERMGFSECASMYDCDTDDVRAIYESSIAIAKKHIAKKLAEKEQPINR